MKYTHNMWIGHFVIIFPSYDGSIEGGALFSATYVVGCWWLLAAVFASAVSTPHLGAFEARGTLSE